MNFLKAVEHGNTKEVDRMLLHSSNPKDLLTMVIEEEEKNTGNGTTHTTPLMVAVKKRRYKVVRLLLETASLLSIHPSLMDGRSYHTSMSMSIAISNRDIDMVNILLSYGISCSAYDVYHIINNATNIPAPIVDSILSSCVDRNIPFTITNKSMMIAIRKGKHDVLGVMLKHGANPMRRRRRSTTHSGWCDNKLLITAIRGGGVRGGGRGVRVGCIGCVKVLLEYGADPNEGYIELDVIRGDDDVDYDVYKETYPLLEALSQWEISYRIVQLLLEHGTDPNITSNSIHSGATPIMIAAYKGRSDIVSLLLDYDADLNLTDMYGDSVYDIEDLSPSVAKVLYYSDPSIIDHQHFTDMDVNTVV